MANVFRLDDHRWQLEFELPWVQPEDIPVIKSIKERFWFLMWYEYLKRYVSVSEMWKNMISKDCIKQNELPYHIQVHLEKLEDSEKRELSAEISRIMKETKYPRLKEQLFYLRTKILSSIKNN
ncbi:MAG: hypothetical protein ACD_2C00184G0001 [uncultured bacterium (gcode 4)]|uniref:Uncharacterized protein n=1 Tax=uncultured bacterium (gcode 4) TaxID=1234023 RepID=K2GG47_9BACT|nr:MAG: hypothetical protein ACD_2C00184G0001 [uncultured bacterium (gcode 4)]